MSETLVMHLPAPNTETAHFAMFDEVGGLIQQHYHADMHLIAEHARHRRVVVVVPSMAVSCLRVTLPKLSARAMRHALPYALEDQLIADTNTLHYTLLQAQPNEVSDVLVVDKAVMQTWLATCDGFQVVPDAFIPSALMLLCEPLVWTVVVRGDVDIRIGQTAIFSCDLANVNAVLKQAMLVYGEPKSLNIYSEAALALETTVPVVETKLSPSAMADLYLNDVPSSSAFNLLHSEFQPRQKHATPSASLMKSLRLGVGVWLILVLMFPMVSWVMLTSHDLALQHSIKTIARHYFPDVNSVTASRLRLQEKLKQASGGGQDAVLFHLLAGLSHGMKAVPGMQIEQLHFQTPQLSVTVNAQSSSIFSEWSQALSSQGLQVKASSAVISGGRVHAVVIIRKI